MVGKAKRRDDMGIFDRALIALGNAGNNMSMGAANTGAKMGTTAQDSSEIVALKMQIGTLNQELDATYSVIGRRYVQYVIEKGEMPGIDVSDMLKMMEPKLERLKELERKLIEAEKRVKDIDILRAKERAEHEFYNEKNVLDRALAMDVLTQEEYSKRLAVARKKLDNFEEIRRVRSQLEMGLISREEFNARMGYLTR